MKAKQTIRNRLCSCLLVLAMILTFLPVSALAFDEQAEQYIFPMNYSLDNSGVFETETYISINGLTYENPIDLSWGSFIVDEMNTIDLWVTSEDMKEGDTIPYFRDEFRVKWELSKIAVSNHDNALGVSPLDGNEAEQALLEITSETDRDDYKINTADIMISAGNMGVPCYVVWYGWKMAEGEEIPDTYQVSYDLNLPEGTTTIYPVVKYATGTKMSIDENDGDLSGVTQSVAGLTDEVVAGEYTIPKLLTDNGEGEYIDFLAFDIKADNSEYNIYYDFKGWEINGTTYNTGDVIGDISTLADETGNVTFQAKWELVTPLATEELEKMEQEQQLSLELFLPYAVNNINQTNMLLQWTDSENQTSEPLTLDETGTINYKITVPINQALTGSDNSTLYYKEFMKLTVHLDVDDKLEFANVSDGKATLTVDPGPMNLIETNLFGAEISGNTITFDASQVPDDIEITFQWFDGSARDRDLSAPIKISGLEFKLKDNLEIDPETFQIQTSANITGTINARQKTMQNRFYYRAAYNLLTDPVGDTRPWLDYFGNGTDYTTGLVHALQFMDYVLKDIDLKSNEMLNLTANTVTATYLDTVTITPADITVYTGGEGYTGVVDGEGQTTTTANGLPEPGYYITLPDWLNEELGGNADAEDLSEELVLTYDDDQGGHKEWKLEPYGTAAHSTDVASVEAARYIYRIVPGEGTENTPVRLQLTDPENEDQIISSDDFVPSSDEQYKEYDMRIYTDEVTADKVTAKITIDDQTYTCKVEGTEGQLVVRGLTGEDITTDIVNSESQLSGSNISALAPAGVTYYVNGSKVEVSDTGGVKLLVDDVLSDGVLAAYIEENITSIPAGNYTYEEKYLDLVDTKNGNAYLTLGEGQKMTMYWPVPSNMNTSKNYYIVHFEALDRNYNNMNQELETTPPTTVAGTSLVTVNGKQYIKFETDSFSPFVLVYEKTTGGGGGGGGTTRYTITAEAGDGGSISPSGRVSVTAGANRTFTITADDGYEIADVIVDDESVGAVSSYTFKNVRANHTIKVIFKEEAGVADPDDTGVSSWLNTDDHTAYLSGYPNNLFGANNNMTRAEVAQMFCNLLLDKDVAITVAFDDVAADAWYADAVNTLASLGMIEGVGNNLFEPERSITRAEFTTIAMRFTNGMLEGENIFPDVNPGDWFYDYVVGSIQYGWINGYPDGTFGPNNTITRAEVTTIVNRMLGRSADEDYVDSHTTDLRQFTDLADTHWAYYDIMEATNGHDYSKSGSAETWRGLHN